MISFSWLQSTRPHVIGFSCYVWNISFVLLAAKAAKELNPELLILFGGQQIRGRYVEHLLEKERCVDICVVGEGEIPFQYLMRNIVSGAPPLEEIPGLAYLQDDRYRYYGSEEAVKDL